MFGCHFCGLNRHGKVGEPRHCKHFKVNSTSERQYLLGCLFYGLNRHDKVAVPLHCLHFKVNSTSECQYLLGFFSMDYVGMGR